MGRKSLDKKRKHHPERKEEWAKKLIPHFQRSGLRDFTMDNVAELLNVSKATVYKYFKSREEIVELCVAVKLDEVRHFSEILTDTHIPFLERYFLSLEDLTGNVADISNAFLSDLKQLFPATWEMVNSFIEYALQILKEYYEEGISKRLLDKSSASLMVMSDRFFLQSLSDPNFLDSHKLTLQEAFRQYFRMKFFGIVKDRKKLKKFL